ncbi:MAG TPA: organomercurial lyase [Thermoanaerobaculia bacterium]|nr:organomercurial lyase [Thermoanaerobaculia bacterium]
MSTAAAQEPDVRAFVYGTCRTRGLPPSIAQTAEALDRSPADIQSAFQRLAEAHVLVLQPGGEILMASPFSAVPTPFPVQVGPLACYGNCIWDALGIPAMLHGDARISTSCACCGAQLGIDIVGGALQSRGGLIHFGIPAHRWWDNIVFT